MPVLRDLIFDWSHHGVDLITHGDARRLLHIGLNQQKELSRARHDNAFEVCSIQAALHAMAAATLQQRPLWDVPNQDWIKRHLDSILFVAGLQRSFKSFSFHFVASGQGK